MTDDLPLLLTVAEAAALLRLGRNTTYQLAREHRLPSVRLGRRLLIPRAALLAWLERESAVASGNGVLEFSRPRGC